MVICHDRRHGLIMWLGELITDRGIGNGMSILMFISIAAGFPATCGGSRSRASWPTAGSSSASSIACGLAMVGLVVFVEQAQRRIPVQYAKRMIGRRSYGGTSTYIPLKVNQAGVIPVIFASSLLYIPQLDRSVQQDPSPGWADWMEQHFAGGDHPDYITHVLPAHCLLRLLLRRHLLQPRRSCRKHEEVWWVHPGYPGGTTHG